MRSYARRFRRIPPRCGRPSPLRQRGPRSVGRGRPWRCSGPRCGGRAPGALGPAPPRRARAPAPPLAAEGAWFLAHAPAAILFVSDPEQSRCVALPDQLRAVFGLTRTEALVAAEIFRGEGLPAAADALGIGVTTARTHLQRIFGKT